MANPYTDEDRDPSEDVGGGLPVGLDTSTSDRLRGLTFTPQAGSTGISFSDQVRSNPLAGSTSPNNFSWAGTPESGLDSSSGGLNFTQPPAASPMNPLGLTEQPGLPMAPPPSPYQQQLEGYLRQYQQMAADPLSAFFMRLQGTDPAAAPLRLLGQIDTARRQAESDQMTRETHASQQTEALIKSVSEFQRLITDPMLSDAQREQLFNGVGRRVYQMTTQLAAGTDLAGVVSFDQWKKDMLQPGSFDNLIGGLRIMDPSQLPTLKQVIREKGFAAGADWLRKDTEDRYKDSTGHAAALAEAVVKDEQANLPAGSRVPEDKVRSRGLAWIDAQPGDSVTLPDGSTMSKVQAREFYARYMSDKAFKGDRTEMGIGIKPVTLAKMTSEQEDALGQTREWKDWAATHGNPVVSDESRAQFAQDTEATARGRGYQEALTSARRILKTEQQTEEASRRAADVNAQKNAQLDVQRQLDARRTVDEAHPKEYGPGKIQLISADPKSPTYTQPIGPTQTLEADRQRLQDAPVGTPGRMIAADKDMQNLLRSNTMVKAQLAQYATEAAALPEGPGVRNQLSAFVSKLRGDQNFINATDALKESIVAEAKANTGTSRFSNQMFKVFEQANVRPNMSKAEIRQMIDIRSNLIDLRNGVLTGNINDADSSRMLADARQRIERINPQARGGRRTPSQSDVPSISARSGPNSMVIGIPKDQ